MITILIQVLVLALILAILWWAFSLLPFMQGVPMQIFGVILALILVVYLLKAFNIIDI